MYIDKKELIRITNNQIKRLEYNSMTNNREYKLLNRLKLDLESNIKVEIGEIKHILYGELNLCNRAIDHKLSVGEEINYLHFMQERLEYTIRELNKLSLKIEYEEVIK